jgi:predicted nucleic acid-binding protein
MDTLPVFTLDADVIATAKELIRHKAMPAEPCADAYHLALAIHYDCAVLVTWDRKHLANPNKFVHVTRITERLGVTAPVIATPRELLRRMG